jgi:hypothetical protein
VGRQCSLPSPTSSRVFFRFCCPLPPAPTRRASELGCAAWAVCSLQSIPVVFPPSPITQCLTSCPGNLPVSLNSIHDSSETGPLVPPPAVCECSGTVTAQLLHPTLTITSKITHSSHLDHAQCILLRTLDSFSFQLTCERPEAMERAPLATGSRQRCRQLASGPEICTLLQTCSPV